MTPAEALVAIRKVTEQKLRGIVTGDEAVGQIARILTRVGQ